MMRNEKTRIVVIGAGYSGLLAALRLARRTKLDQATLTLVNASDQFVERIRLHQLVAGQRLPTHSLARLLSGTRIEFIEGKVTALDPVGKGLTVHNQSGTQRIAYDQLIYALGSRIDRSGVPGAAEYSHTLNAFSTQELANALPALANSGGRLLIVGGGLTGIELATELAESYPQLYVELATAGVLGEQLSAAGVAYLREVFGKLNIAVHEHTLITHLKAGQALTADGSTLPFDQCVWTAGFSVPALAKESGLAVNAAGQVIVDAELRSVSHPAIFAVGDAAAFAPETGLSLRMACATAMPMGAHAAGNVATLLNGKVPRPFAFGFVVRCISLGRRRGLVQFTHPDDAPARRVITGWPAAVIKELICRATWYSLLLERRVGSLFYWPHTLRANTHEFVTAVGD